MTEAVFLIVEYQTWIYALLGLVALVYLRALWRARRTLGQTPFGLEREAALQKLNGALAMLIIVGALALSVFILDRYVAPELQLRSLTPEPGAAPTPLPSPTPIGLQGGGGVVIDSSGCENPQVTLSEPPPDARLSGSFEVRGTANIDNFAYYTLEISGERTGGVWVPLFVGNDPVTQGQLGTLDSSAYDSGEYALRLVVRDNTGNAPPPCVIPVTIVAIGVDAPP
jgi:hypothetical protein